VGGGIGMIVCVCLVIEYVCLFAGVHVLQIHG
jgi:hypothetical protein